MMMSAALASLRRLAAAAAAAAAASSRSPAAIRPFSSVPHLSSAALRRRPLAAPLRPSLLHARGFFDSANPVNKTDDADMTDLSESEVDYVESDNYTDFEPEDFSDGEVDIDDFDESSSGSD